ncbi:MAG TPA: hypothetical protein PKK15_12790, partial [Kouleothrix sp.]|nr:hypothetical protein [Kouleothrix sp.]
GHFDLTNFMGIPGQFRHPDYIAAVRRIVAACEANGKTAAFLATDDAWAREYAYLAAWHALLLAERLRGTSPAELGKRHKIGRLAGEDARWREAVRWGLSGIMVAITPATLADHLDELGADGERRARVGRILERIHERIAVLGEKLGVVDAPSARR